jgi:signal transduction histidine kinase
LLVGLALAVNVGSAWWVLLQQRELHENLSLLTRVYVPFYEDLGQAQASDLQLRRVRESMTGALEGPSSGRPPVNDAIVRAALQDRAELLRRSREPIRRLVAERDASQDSREQNPAWRDLHATMVRLEELVLEDDASRELDAESGTSDHESVSRWNRIGALFRELRTRGEAVLEQQERAIDASRRRAEQTAWFVSAVALTISFFCVIGVIFTVRPLRRLTSQVRGLAQGKWQEGVKIDSSPRRDNEVSRLLREFELMAQALHEREQRIIVSEKLAAIGQLAAQITHEIRNPLSALALNVELLGDEIADAGPTAQRLVLRVDQEVDRLAQITESYLALARQGPPDFVRFDLAHDLRSLLEFLAVEHERAKIEIRTHGLARPAWIRGDSRLLRQAFLNLLRNAQDAVLEARSTEPENGATRSAQITVALSSDRGPIHVDVCDTGAGIPLPRDEVNRVFEPFFSSKRQGTGLGLPMVQRIVAEHGGAVSVLSTGDDGTCVRVELPACDPQDSSVSSEPS